MNNRDNFRAACLIGIAVSFFCVNGSLFAGQLVAWGSNSYGQCNVPAGDDFIAVAAAWHSLALKADGSLVSWGDVGAGTYDVPAGNDFIAISAANYHCLALKSDGSIVAWGSSCLNVPTGNDFIAIAAGGTQSLALRSNGSLVSWGSITTVPSGSDFIAIGSGSYHNLALRANGTVVRWGSFGIQEFPGTFIKIAAGENYDIAIRADGSVIYLLSGYLYEYTYKEVDAGDYYWAGIKSDGTLFDSGGNTVPAGNDYSAIAVGVYHGLAIKGSSETPGGTGGYSGGNGTTSDPYQIGSVADWQELMLTPADWDKHFILVADIDLAGISLTPIGNSGSNFIGTFDGNGHVIGNVVFNRDDLSEIGLFGYLGTGGRIKNLGVVNANIQGNSYVGGIVGYNNGGIIVSSYFDGAVSNTGNYLGGIVGMNDQGTINSCYSIGSVSGHSYIGGLVGQNHYGTILFCYATSDVAGTYLQSYCIGGLVGWNWSAIITASFATGEISSAGSLQVGGFVAVNTGTINSCYAMGNVSGSSDLGYVGGFVSQNYNGGTINNSYSIGAVSANWYVGGFAGSNDTSVTSSFWDTQTSGNIIAVGNGSTDGITGKTTAEMQTLSMFLDAGWDFVGEAANGTNDYWVMPQGGGYPEIAYWSNNETVSLPIIFPNGGETLVAGDSCLITWANTGTINEITLELSIDNGNNWSSIALGILNTGAYSWTVPQVNSNQCLIRISDSSDSTVSDTSNASFRISTENVHHDILGELLINGNAESGDMTGWISEGVFAVQSGAGLPNPYGGSYFFSGLALNPYAYQEIDVNNYSVDIDSGLIKSTFTAYLASPAMDPVSVTVSFKNNSGGVIESYTFGPPPLDNQWRRYSLDNHTVPAGTRIIHVRLDFWCAGGVVAEGCADELSLVLSKQVSDTANVTLLAPNGGENLISGEEFLIEWSSTGNIPEVLIEYSIDNGQNWLGVEPTNVGNTSSCNWPIPAADSDECLVRISNVSAPSTTDASDAVFSINPPAPVVIQPTVNIDPNTLNLGSSGKWITAYLYFPKSCTVSEINRETILLNQIVPADWHWFDVVTNLLKVKFSRAAVEALVQPGDAVLTITGEFTDGQRFEGTDTIRVIDNFQPDEPEIPYTCTTYPQMDFNEDCRVDLEDYAIFMSHWLECTREPIGACKD